MATNLLDTGKWLRYSGDCVYSTVSSKYLLDPRWSPIFLGVQDYWFQGSEEVEDQISLRFLTTPSTFCIISLLRPTNGHLVVNKRVPVLPGDEIFLLKQDVSGSHQGRSSGLPWLIHESTGQLVINVSEDDLLGTDYAWAFEVRYKGDR